MTKQEIIDLCANTAKEAQIRDDVCSRSTLIGLKAYFDIPDDLIRASTNLCGGAGAASGSCGTYTCGQLALGQCGFLLGQLCLAGLAVVQ